MGACERAPIGLHIPARMQHLADISAGTEVLKWAGANGWTRIPAAFQMSFLFWSEWLPMGQANSETGHDQVLKWARENVCEWDADVCAAGALAGQATVLKWAKRKV